VRWWALTCCDHLAARWWEAAWEAAGWYVFAPVAIVRLAPTPRMAGDGPTSALDYVVVARPRHRMPAERMGSRPGYYLQPGLGPTQGWVHPGAKSLNTMRAMVRDYSLPGDVVADAYGGSFTTALAAAIEGRRAVSCEKNPDTFAKGKARIDRGYTPQLFIDAPRGVQPSLLP
jgi:hypothetical protein